MALSWNRKKIAVEPRKLSLFFETAGKDVIGDMTRSEGMVVRD
jgi:hypothetical protein